MGYNTQFNGELKFNSDLTGKQLAKIKSFLDEDCRDHPEWGREDLTYIDLQFLDDFSGLKWNGAEKTYDLADKINVIIDEMKKEFPDFSLSGKLLAKGEDIDNNYWIEIVDGHAVNIPIDIIHNTIICPHCGKKFLF